jgi:hypothetical protein
MQLVRRLARAPPVMARAIAWYADRVAGVVYLEPRGEVVGNEKSHVV